MPFVFSRLSLLGVFIYAFAVIYGFCAKSALFGQFITSLGEEKSFCIKFTLLRNFNIFYFLEAFTIRLHFGENSFDSKYVLFGCFNSLHRVADTLILHFAFCAVHSKKTLD